MTETDTGNLEYLYRAYKGLSSQKKAIILEMAHSLLEIQDKNTCLFSGREFSNGKKENRCLQNLKLTGVKKEDFYE